MVEPLRKKTTRLLLSRRDRFFGGMMVALVSAVSASAGCQSFAPASLGRLSSAHADKRIAKQAAAEHFPSPADVGLAPATPP